MSNYGSQKEVGNVFQVLKKRIVEKADSRSKKNYNSAASGRKTTFTERQTK